MTILWDWNGTLLDDAEPIAALTDKVFRENGYRGTTLEEYRWLFRFPVHDYYRDMGVPEEDFDRMAWIWTDASVKALGVPGLRSDTLSVLRRFREAGFRQVIVSAAEQSQLETQLGFHPELAPLLDEVNGLGDIYAVSKIQLARDYLERTGTPASEAVFIGDTTHDAEVAKALGLRCILCEGGHQSPEVMQSAGFPVVESLSGAADLLLGSREA